MSSETVAHCLQDAQLTSCEVHEISGVVPTDTISGLLSVVGVDQNGVNPALTNGGFEAVRSAVKKVGREGWSAGQVLEQVCQTIDSPGYIRVSDADRK